MLSHSDYIVKQELYLKVDHVQTDIYGVYHAEVLDIRGSAKCMSRNTMANTGVIIYSDSKAVIRSLQAIWLYTLMHELSLTATDLSSR